ncbi:cupin domain-containing protein [Pseudorhodoplanes sinuspersici]|uniref:Uncharacterized protein n=1 Tax=Pseudorhodoplanes sinuspersici TaxID=1235591 RepID=A0A1W6ZRY4_9HYPH|nr:cupin domain-containing protein [Pseudorhodoplanes sinuspersici]ARQ00038.1 hypothetical protein CAK95_13810 [Pseudorhodoplanes sinuspersici]RKE71074.1 uncharacterized protein YjlB [Pseudorhodoplanes sinuspersici]
MPSAGTKVRTFLFADDGIIPNNPTLPLVLYPNVFDLTDTRDPASVIEMTFAKNGWGDGWRNGIYPYVHYHSRIHEALAVARGKATVRFGGNHGEEIDIAAGDAVVLPAGTGHHGLTTSSDFVLIGAYPPAGTYDLCLASATERAKALQAIPTVPLPDKDPIFGRDGPLLHAWR